MRTIKEMKARKNDCRLKAIKIIEQAEKEDRFLTHVVFCFGDWLYRGGSGSAYHLCYAKTFVEG